MFGAASRSTATIYCRSVSTACASMLRNVRPRPAVMGSRKLRLNIPALAADIASTDLANIVSRLNSSPYITQEVIFGSGEPITPNEYVGIGEWLRLEFGKISR